MPTESENIQYLYLVLTNDGIPIIDWDAIAAAMNLSKGAVSKRWSRLRQSIDKGEAPSGSTYQFLWLCVKNSTRTQPFNWAEIAAKCNTTVGAASKRYSRMKKAFEDDDAAPSLPAAETTPAKPKATPRSRAKKNGDATASGNDTGGTQDTPVKAKATPKSTTKKTKAATTPIDDTQDADATSTVKRKRAAPKKTPTTGTDKAKYKSDADDDYDDDDDDEEFNTPSKSARLNTFNPINKPKPKSMAKPAVKNEPAPEDSEAQDFIDTQEHLTGNGNDETDNPHHKPIQSPSSEPLTSSTGAAAEDCEQCTCYAKEVANVLMSRHSGLAREQRVELEKMVGVVDLTE